MTRIVAIVVALFVVLTCCTSCLDQEPAELSVRTSQGGQPLDSLVMLFNGKGVQVQEVHTERGFVIVKALKPGTYFVKVKDYNQPPTIYPAVRKIELTGGDSKVLDIDVDDATKNAADFPTSS